MHQECAQTLVFDKHKVPHLDPLQAEAGMELYQDMACTKRCLMRYQKEMCRYVLANYTVPFHQDGPCGKMDPVNSESIVMNWLITGDNFFNFCGNNPNSNTKLEYGQILADLICSKGIKPNCCPKDIVQKICNYK